MPAIYLHKIVSLCAVIAPVGMHDEVGQMIEEVNGRHNVNGEDIVRVSVISVV